ncbi:MAG: hypothetical protein K8R54_14395 [Bacteroidales bacterium]|nr:hypothetical protein [Bacteroidales bacterium]
MNIKGKLFLILLIFIVFACDKNLIDNSDGKLVSHTLCKNEKNIVFDTGESCIEYSYDAERKVLNLKHINTAFNCCPDKLYCKISINNDTIIIEEFERKQECDCICLYDIETEVYNIEAKTYVLKFIEPYLGDQEELVFEIDLSFNISGTYCVERTNYPWGI